MTEENTTSPELEFDVVDAGPPQPKVFMYDVAVPNQPKQVIAVISMNATDAKAGLLARLPPESTLLRVGVVADAIVQV